MSIAVAPPTIAEALLKIGGARIAARVRDARGSIDFALTLGGSNVGVVRYVERVARSDYRALKAMVAEGDFDRAALIYCDPEQPHLSNEIESWPIGDIDKLAASLAAWAQRS